MFTVLETAIQGLHFRLCNLLYIFTVVYALCKWLILIFSETTEASSFKIERGIALDNIYISTGNDVARHLRSATNRINVFILGHVLVAKTRLWFNRF